MATLTNHVIRGRNDIARDFWYFGNYCNIFLPNIGEDQKKVLPSERRAPGTVPHCRPGPGHCVTFIKRLNECLRLQRLEQKTLNFTWVVHLNWLAKIELRGPGPPGSQYYC